MIDLNKSIVSQFTADKLKERAAQKETSRANLLLRMKSKGEWLGDIQKLPGEMRAPVAKIVWWDWLSSGPGNLRAASEFDQYLAYSDVEYPERDMINGFLAVGYTELQATTRLRRKK
jgi:hypothetical protein